MKKYDFYYSAEKAGWEKYNLQSENHTIRKIRNKEYNIMIPHKGRLSNYKWEDIVFVGTGTLEECTFT